MADRNLDYSWDLCLFQGLPMAFELIPTIVNPNG